MAKKNRLRSNLQKFYLSDKELTILAENMKAIGVKNKSEYFRDMVLKGEKIVINFDYANMDKLVFELNKIGNNLNQIAKVTNEKRNIFNPEILELQNLMAQVNKIVADEFKKVTEQIEEIYNPTFIELFENESE